MQLICLGKGRVELGRGDEVIVRASSYPFPTVMGQPMEWFSSISQTLRWNTRSAEQKGWSGGDDLVDVEKDENKESGFDIDFDDDEAISAKDSGYESEKRY